MPPSLQTCRIHPSWPRGNSRAETPLANGTYTVRFPRVVQGAEACGALDKRLSANTFESRIFTTFPIGTTFWGGRLLADQLIWTGAATVVASDGSRMRVRLEGPVRGSFDVTHAGSTPQLALQAELGTISSFGQVTR